MTQNLLSIKELEGRAMRNIRNYEGNSHNVQRNETGRNYAGQNAALTAQSTYSLTIKNVGSAAEDQTIAIVPAYFTTAAKVKDATGTAVAAIIKEGTVIATTNKEVTAVGKPKSIDEFLLFVLHNPVRVTGIKMSVDNSAQFSEDILIRKESPLRDLGFMTISPANYKNSQQMNDKIVEIPLPDAQFDNQTSVVTKIQAGRTVTITFFFGAIRNEAALLDQDVKMASGAGFMGR